MNDAKERAGPGTKSAETRVPRITAHATTGWSKSKKANARDTSVCPQFHNTLLLSFTASASTYTSPPICLNFSLICAMPCSLSLRLAA